MRESQLIETALIATLRSAGCVFAEEEAALLVEAASTLAWDDAALTAVVDRRVAGVPQEHLLGWVDFAGVRVQVARVSSFPAAEPSCLMTSWTAPRSAPS